MSPVFELKAVHKIYAPGEAGEVRALNDIHLQINAKEFSALVGPSGSGKSTLLNVMSGLDQASSGHIFLGGEDLAQMSPQELADFRRDHIGFVFQSFNLIPVLNVEENIEYVMLLQGINNATRRERVSRILEEVGLQGMQKKRPHELSGGQQQRVAVARAIVARPRIILADEPTANLDSKTGGDLLDLMGELNENHDMTFVFSTHDRQIMERARRLIHLRDGCIERDEVK